MKKHLPFLREADAFLSMPSSYKPQQSLSGVMANSPFPSIIKAR